MYVVKAAEMTFLRKIRRFNVEEINGRAQIHQRFFASNFRTKFWRQKFQTQNTAFVRKMLM